jgi:hypothetical protein
MQNMENIDFGRLWRRWDETIEMYLTEMVYELESLASLQISTTSGCVSEMIY